MQSDTCGFHLIEIIVSSERNWRVYEIRIRIQNILSASVPPNFSRELFFIDSGKSFSTKF